MAIYKELNFPNILYLGQYTIDNTVEQFDLYLLPAADAPALIVRFGDEKNEWSMLPVSGVEGMLKDDPSSPLCEAYRRALDKNLIAPQQSIMPFVKDLVDFVKYNWREHCDLSDRAIDFWLKDGVEIFKFEKTTHLTKMCKAANLLRQAKTLGLLY